MCSLDDSRSRGLRWSPLRKALRTVPPRKPASINAEQRDTVKAAKKRLGTTDREVIRKRMEGIANHAQGPQERSSSRGEGPPQPCDKGKGIDPRNWGTVDLASEEQDVDVQRAALAFFKTKCGVEQMLDDEADKYDSDTQHLAYEHWQQQKTAASGCRPIPRPTVETVEDEDNISRRQLLPPSRGAAAPCGYSRCPAGLCGGVQHRASSGVRAVAPVRRCPSTGQASCSRRAALRGANRVYFYPKPYDTGST